jgi:hypothetical protein
MVHEAFRLISQLARMGPLTPPGQAVLDQMIAAIAAAPAPQPA